MRSGDGPSATGFDVLSGTFGVIWLGASEAPPTVRTLAAPESVGYVPFGVLLGMASASAAASRNQAGLKCPVGYVIRSFQYFSSWPTESASPSGVAV